MCLTEEAQYQRYWRGRRLIARLAKDTAVHEQHYGPSSVSPNLFEMLSQFLHSMIRLNENWDKIIDHGADMISAHEIDRLRREFREFSDETERWLQLLNQEKRKFEEGSYKLLESLYGNIHDNENS